GDEGRQGVQPDRDRRDVDRLSGPVPLRGRSQSGRAAVGRRGDSRPASTGRRRGGRRHSVLTFSGGGGTSATTTFLPSSVRAALLPSSASSPLSRPRKADLSGAPVERSPKRRAPRTPEELDGWMAPSIAFTSRS